MSGLQPVRGTRDILPEERRAHRHIEETARQAAERFGYDEVATPIFEFSDVFRRTLGDTSDIVTKEMYTFTDKGGRRDHSAPGRHRRRCADADRRRSGAKSAA